MPETTTTYEHPCPECGGDVTRTRDRFPFTTHGTRAYLLVACTVIIAGYIIAMMLVSNIGTHVTDHQALAANQAQSNPAQYAAPVDTGSIYFEEFQRVLNGRDDELERIREQLRAAIAPESEHSFPQRVDRVRLDVFNREVNLYQLDSYAALGQHFSSAYIIDIKDPRTRAPVSPNATGSGVSHVSYWPGLHIQVDVPQGALRTYSFSYLSFAGFIAIVLFLSWGIARVIPKRWGRKRARWIALALFLIASVIGSLFPRASEEFITMKYYPAIATGPWVDAQRVRDAIDDDESFRAILQELGQGLTNPESIPAALVVTREYDSTNPDPGAPKPVITRWHGWWILQQGSIDLFSIRTTEYDASRTPDQRHSSLRTPFWTHLYHWGRVRYEIHRPSTTIGLDLNLPHIALALSIPWWIWIVLSRIHRFRTWRIQRKRVNRGQCIYCGYRASEEALAARWEDSSPPP